MREICRKSAVDQARLIATGDVSSEEITRIYLERIEAIDGETHAFVQVLADRALAEAKKADRARRASKGKDLPPFHGVPIAVKDLNPVAGSFTRFGSRAFERLVTPFDDATVTQLRRGGFVILGKTATSELGTLPVTEPDIHPPTRNPWDLTVTSGGSSGGAGAAVAAGLVPIAQGSDGAGSVRIPASLCHLVGFKPSRGRVENSYGIDDRWVIYTCGPIARTVTDAAALLDVMAGLVVGKPHWAPTPEGVFVELAERAPARLRLRFATRVAYCETDREVAAAVDKVARTLADLGHDVREGEMIEPKIDEFLPVWQRIAAEAPVHDWELTQPVTRWLADFGKRVTPEETLRLTKAMHDEVLAWFGEVDAWITPAVAVAPPKIGAWKDLPPPEAFARAATLGIFTAGFNVSGQPAVSIPAGRTRAGHPIGVQIAGRPLADATVLALARQIEREMPWADAWPQIALA
jgi:amidase